MMLAWLLLLSVCLQGTPEPLPEAEVALEPRLGAALSELRLRDPRSFEDMRRALRERPADARARLEEHAQYLEELRRAERENPQRYALLLEQQAAGWRVRSAVEEFHGSGEAERESARDALRSALEASFELRHQLREAHVDDLADRLAQERSRLEQTTEDPGAARTSWLERARESRGELLDEPTGEREELEALAPAIVRATLRRDRFRGRRLAQLAESSPFLFRRMLRRAVEELPGLLDEARRARSEEPSQMQHTLRSKWQVLRARVGEFQRPGRRTPLTPEERSELEPVLREIVEAELSITRFNLDRVESRLAEQREVLAFRRANRDLIVELRLAELTGDQARYEW